MLPLFLLITAEFIGLFILSRRVTRGIFLTLYRVFRLRSIAVSLTTFVLFPGTVIHELSHLFSAEILGVKTGKLELAPESIEEEDIRVGSVELTQTDPFRRATIGLAPFFIGVIALLGLSSILPNLWKETTIAFQNNTLFSSPSSYLLPLTSYLLFCISNTMFASKEDMKGVVPLAIVLGILGGAIYMAGFRVGITGGLLIWTQTLMTNIAQSLGVVLVINGMILISTTILLSLTGKKIYF
jgi:hypothetical protein